jgi:hypothetical protein
LKERKQAVKKEDTHMGLELVDRLECKLPGTKGAYLVSEDCLLKGSTLIREATRKMVFS